MACWLGKYTSFLSFFFDAIMMKQNVLDSMNPVIHFELSVHTASREITTHAFYAYFCGRSSKDCGDLVLSYTSSTLLDRQKIYIITSIS